jgi:hypothetical protein
MLDEETCLAEKSFPWEYGQTIQLALDVDGNRLRAWVNGVLFFDVRDERSTLSGGGIGFVIEEGCLSSDWIALTPKGSEMVAPAVRCVKSPGPDRIPSTWAAPW